MSHKVTEIPKHTVVEYCFATPDRRILMIPIVAGAMAITGCGFFIGVFGAEGSQLGWLTTFLASCLSACSLYLLLTWDTIMQGRRSGDRKSSPLLRPLLATYLYFSILTAGLSLYWLAELTPAQ